MPIRYHIAARRTEDVVNDRVRVVTVPVGAMGAFDEQVADLEPVELCVLCIFILLSFGTDRKRKRDFVPP